MLRSRHVEVTVFDQDLHHFEEDQNERRLPKVIQIDNELKM